MGQSARTNAAGPDAAARAKDAFAQCIVRREPKFAAAWLAVLPGSPEEKELIAASQKSFDTCVGKSRVVVDDVTTSYSSLRGPVAVQLLAGRLSRLPFTAPLPQDSQPWFTDSVMAVPDGVMDRGELRTEFFAHCVALAQWPETLAFLRTEREDRSEVPAMKALRPALGDCLTAGTTVSFKPHVLRPMLANAVYHIAMTPPSPPTATPAATPPPAAAPVPAPAPAEPASRKKPAAPQPPATPRLPYGLERL